MYLTFYGRCLIENFSFDKAIKKFNAAIFYNPNDIEGYLYRSLVFIKKGEMPSALHDLTIAKELNPENPILSLHFGFYYQALGQKHDAIKHFEKAKNLGSEYHGLDYFIEELKAKVF
jgi:tetratricopeptide (TPR) repeat protein